MTDAITAQHAREPRSEEEAATKIKEFLSRYGTTRDMVEICNAIPFKGVLFMGNLQGIIHTLTMHFYRSATSNRPHSNGAEVGEGGPSKTELLRIYRAFYRFEIYCGLFRGPTYPGVSRYMSGPFFDVFPPWEVEETACIIGYLLKQYYVLNEEASEGPEAYRSNGAYQGNVLMMIDSGKYDISPKGIWSI